MLRQATTMDAQLEDFRPGLEPNYSDDDQDLIAEAARECVDHWGAFGGAIYQAAEYRELTDYLGRRPTVTEWNRFWTLLVPLMISTAQCECLGSGVNLDGEPCDCKRTELVNGDYPEAHCHKCRATFVAGTVSPVWARLHVNGCNGEVA